MAIKFGFQWNLCPRVENRGVRVTTGALLFGAYPWKINSNMSTISIKAALADQTALGSIITVQGWVRTRRDSKAGVSFINVHDGSCFNPIQSKI